MSSSSFSSIVSSCPGLTSSQFSRLSSLFLRLCSRNSSYDPSSPYSSTLSLSQVLSLLESFNDDSACLTEFEVSDLLLSSQTRSSFSAPTCDFPLFVSLFTRCYEFHDFQHVEEQFNRGIKKIEEEELKSLFDEISEGKKELREEQVKRIMKEAGEEVSELEIKQILSQVDQSGKGSIKINMKG